METFFNQNGSGLFAEGLQNGPKVMNQNIKIRMQFLRKVYSILSFQLTFTTIVSMAIMLSPSIQGFLVQNSWLVFLNLIGGLVTIFPLMYKRNEYPTNFYLLGAFTVFQSVSLGLLISQYDLFLVVQAFFLTAIVVVGLTFYTFQSKHDFTYLNTLLPSLLLVSVVGGLSQIFFRSSFLQTGLTILGVLIFSAYIIYDTKNIMHHLSAEEYITAVINLYLDIINLFIKILRLLNQLKQEDNNRSKKKKRDD